MIRVLIQRIYDVPYNETKNFIVKSTPTEIAEESTSGYSGGTTKKIKCVEEYETKQVPMVRSVTVDILAQNIADEDSFDLQKVIQAINRIVP